MLEDAGKSIDSALRVAVDKATALLKLEIDARTPEDTGLLLSSNRAIPSVTEDKITKGRVENPTSYATYVEYGTHGTAKNYHKPKGTVMRRGLGARMFTLAFDANKKVISGLISEALKQWVSALKK